MKNQADYSKYKCPYSHIEKKCGHKLEGPESFEKTYSVWCACGFRGPVFCLEPEKLHLKEIAPSTKGGRMNKIEIPLVGKVIYKTMEDMTEDELEMEATKHLLDAEIMINTVGKIRIHLNQKAYLKAVSEGKGKGVICPK